MQTQPGHCPTEHAASIFRTLKLFGATPRTQHTYDHMNCSRTAYILCLLLTLSAAAGQSRFFRLLEQYRDPVYKVSDRDLMLDANGFSTGADETPKDLGVTPDYDWRFSHNRQYSASLAYADARMSSDTLRSLSLFWNIALNGSYFESTVINANELIDRADTQNVLSAQGGVQTYAAYEFERYRPLRRERFIFTGVKVNGGTQVNLNSNRLYTNMALSYNYSDWDQSETGAAEFYARVAPQIGVGRPQPVTPLLTALEIERRLREQGIIARELSDTTMLAIARWVASDRAYMVKHDLYEKFYFALLDTILALEPGSDTLRLNAQGAARVREAFLVRYPLLYSGASFRILLELGIRADYPSENGNCNEPICYDDGLSFDRFGTAAIAELDWYRPLSPMLFLSMGSSVGISYDTTSEKNIMAGLYAGMHYLVTNRILASAAARVTDSTYGAEATLDIFIEDHLRVGVRYSTLSAWHTNAEPVERTRRTFGQRISLRIGYDF